MKVPLLFVSVAVGACLVSIAQQRFKDSHPIFERRGIHPAIANWYYSRHPHAFDCNGGEYTCKSCPVGSPGRVIKVPNAQKAYDAPTEINAFFACSDINMLVPGKGSDADYDSFLCEREPHDGFVVVDGQKISCADNEKSDMKSDIGILRPGESKTVTIPVK